jgi:hypothetical protein
MSQHSGGFFTSYTPRAPRSYHGSDQYRNNQQTFRTDLRPGLQSGLERPVNQDNGPAVRPDQAFENVPRGPKNSGQLNTPGNSFPYRYTRPSPNHQLYNHQLQHPLQSSHSPQQSTYQSQGTLSRQHPASLPPANNQAWTSNAASNYNDIYDFNESSSVRKARGSRGTVRQSGPSEASRGIKGRKFGYALIGKDAEQYATEELREQLVSAMTPIVGEPAAPSPMTSSSLTPRMIVDEFRVAGHLQITQKELQSHFQAHYKDEFLKPLEAILLHHIKDMTPEARKKLASQDERVQETGLKGWLDDSGDVADVIDDFLERLRGEASDGSSLFANRGAIGRNLENRLDEVIQAEKRRIEHRKGDSSDEEGGDSTPLNKGSTASGGSQTPMTST